jgi:hypothetical protein
MGMVIDFPAMGRYPRGLRLVAGRSEPATVIILPVVRIERFADEPNGDVSPEASGGGSRRRRRRVTRS